MLKDPEAVKWLSRLELRMTGHHSSLNPRTDIHSYLFQDNDYVHSDTVILVKNDLTDTWLLKINRYYSPLDVRHNTPRVQIVNNEELAFTRYRDYDYLSLELLLEQNEKYEIWRSKKIIPNSVEVKFDNIFDERHRDGKQVNCTYIICEDLECFERDVTEEYDRFSDLHEEL